MQRPANPLHGATLHLAFHKAQVHRLARIDKSRAAHNIHLTRLGIHRDIHDGASKIGPTPVELAEAEQVTGPPVRSNLPASSLKVICLAGSLAQLKTPWLTSMSSTATSQHRGARPHLLLDLLSGLDGGQTECRR